MNPELQALQQMLQLGSTAKGSLAGLDEQQATAAALRDTPDYRGNSKGQQSIFGHLANTIQRNTGKRQIAELAPQREAARADMANAATALPMFKLQQEQKAIELAAKNRLEERDWEKAEIEYNRGKRGTSLAMWTPEGDEVQVGLDDRGKSINPDTGEPMNISGLLSENPAVTAANIAKNNRSGSRDSFNRPSAKQTDEFEEASRTAADVRDVISKFTPEYANPAGGAPLAGSASNFIAREAPLFASEDAEKRQGWWSKYKKAYELPVRHKMFGSALTATEMEQWRQASINPNMTDSQIRTNLAEIDRLTQLALNQMGKNATIKNWDTEWIEYNTGYGGKEDEYRATTIAPLTADGQVDYNTVPNGIDPTEWGDLTDDQKQDYYDYGEG